MKILISGNPGSGKSTPARRMAREHGLAHLDLDCMVREQDKIAVQRDPNAISESLEAFFGAHERWVVEGCYGELVESARIHGRITHTTGFSMRSRATKASMSTL